MNIFDANNIRLTMSKHNATRAREIRVKTFYA